MTTPDHWVILLVQNADPSERFIGPFAGTEANAWVDRQVASGATWSRLVVAPLEMPKVINKWRSLLRWLGLIGCPYRGHPQMCLCDEETNHA